jgi:hypothetical protein
MESEESRKRYGYKSLDVLLAIIVLGIKTTWSCVGK